MSDKLSRLRAENARLRALLAQHGIAADEQEPMASRKSGCTIIDQCIGWYGSVNLMGRSIADASVIRMAAPEFAQALLDASGI